MRRHERQKKVVGCKKVLIGDSGYGWKVKNTKEHKGPQRKTNSSRPVGPYETICEDEMQKRY